MMLDLELYLWYEEGGQRCTEIKGVACWRGQDHDECDCPLHDVGPDGGSEGFG